MKRANKSLIMENKTVRDTIEAFKLRNGNNNYTQKELTIYLVEKIDRIETVLLKGSGKIATNRAKIDAVMKFGTIFLPILCALLGWLFIRTIS